MPTLLYNNIAFVHVPKTAGSSISSLIPTAELFIQKHADASSNSYLLLHAPAKIVKEREQPSSIIAFVRNPYSRFISIFCMSKNLGIHSYDISIQGITQFCSDFKQSAFSSDYIFKPMKYYLYDNTTCLADHIFRYENLANDVQSYLQIMQITDSPTEIPYINNNLFLDKSEYNSWYQANPMLYDFVNDIYAEDFTAFNYAMVSNSI